MTSNNELQGYLLIAANLNDRPCEIRLRMPPTGWDLPLLLPDQAEEDDAGRQNRLGLVIDAYVESVDGEPLDRSLRTALAANGASRAGLLGLRENLLESLRHHGRIFLRCPHCEMAEAELDLAALSIAVGPDPWPVAGHAGEPVAPSLATRRAPGKRPVGISPAARARIVLPARRAGLPTPYAEGEFGGTIEAGREEDAWIRWGRDGLPLAGGPAHWRRTHPGFRAILRMALALARLDGDAQLGPDVVETLPMADFVFADAVFHLLHHVDVSDTVRARLTCPSCREQFLAVCQ